MANQSADVVIVGGGVIGCIVAYQLGKRGISAIVVEQGEIGMQASSAATGMLAPFKPLGKLDDPYLTLQRASLALFPSLVAELEELTGISSEYHETGCIRLVRPEQLARLERWAAAWRDIGVSMQVLQGDDLARVEPALAEGYQVAVSIPCEPQVRAVAYMRAVAQAAARTGAVLVSGSQVIGVERDGSRVIAVRTAQGEAITCGSLVVAAGAWSGIAGKLLGLHIPVTPAGGQSIELCQPPRPVAHIIFGEGIYLAPKLDGRLYVGATHEEMGFCPCVSPDGMARLLDTARRLVPGLSGCRVDRSWAGLRPATPDRRPILGLASGWDNVALACGHNGFGILLSPVTGQIIADLLEAGNVPAGAQPFSLSRFGSSALNVV